jgi:hypothetical protein
MEVRAPASKHCGQPAIGHPTHGSTKIVSCYSIHCRNRTHVTFIKIYSFDCNPIAEKHVWGGIFRQVELFKRRNAVSRNVGFWSALSHAEPTNHACNTHPVIKFCRCTGCTLPDRASIRTIRSGWFYFVFTMVALPEPPALMSAHCYVCA